MGLTSVMADASLATLNWMIDIVMLGLDLSWIQFLRGLGLWIWELWYHRSADDLHSIMMTQ